MNSWLSYSFTTLANLFFSLDVVNQIVLIKQRKRLFHPLVVSQYVFSDCLGLGRPSIRFLGPNCLVRLSF